MHCLADSCCHMGCTVLHYRSAHGFVTDTTKLLTAGSLMATQGSASWCLRQCHQRYESSLYLNESLGESNTPGVMLQKRY
jgi:hypothetical protein